MKKYYIQSRVRTGTEILSKYTYDEDEKDIKKRFKSEFEYEGLHFQSRIEIYVQDHPNKKFEVNARYNGYEPRPFKISEIWEDLKKVTKLDEESLSFGHNYNS